ncbi:MAG TPA: Flp family type IVb pilin [Alphaproteobacteria bacterium]|nr:Flp family type IVb pilin [Alphaproteobacteria bacterium]
MKVQKRISARLSFTDLLAEEDGATAIEYGLVAALISVFILVAIGTVGDGVVSLFELISQAFPS